MNAIRRATYTLHLIYDLPYPREAVERLDWWPFIRSFDRLLARLEQGDGIHAVMLRGSTLPLERYLMFRPEAYDLIQALVEAGKMHIGPFFALPDYWLPHPEAHIRNLQIGLATARLFGAPPMNLMHLGYLLGGTGLPAQMPQILRGFGIEAALIDRGLGDETIELDWKGLDGSTIRIAYTPQDAILSAEPDRATLTQLREKLARYSLSGHLPLIAVAPTGPDSGPITGGSNGGLAAAITAALPDAVMQSSLPDYLRKLREGRALKTVSGELRSPERRAIRTGAASANLWIKALSHTTETALLRHAEPLAALAEVLHGQAAPQAGLRAAWQELLTAQGALDGATPDALRVRTEGRFEAAGRFAATLANEALTTVGRHIRRPAGSPRQVLVFNPSQSVRTDYLALDDYGLNRAFAVDVPPLGFRLVAVDSEPLTPFPPLATDLTIENEFIRAQVDPAGPTLTLTDKVRDVTYYRLLHVLSEGDQGDIHSFAPVGRGIQNARDLHSESLASYRCRYYEWLRYGIALSLDPAPEMQPDPTPSSDPIRLSVFITLRLTAGVPRLDVAATVYNILRNHRVRVHLPLPFMAERAIYDGSFALHDLPIEDLPPISPPDGWAETPVGTRPVKAFAAVFDPAGARTGLVVANRGIPEVEILSDEDGHSEIALTALRSVRENTALETPTRSTQDPLGLLTPTAETSAAESAEAESDAETSVGMMPGSFTAEFSLIPADWANRQAAFEQGWAFADGPLRAAWPRPAGQDPDQPELKDSGSLVTVSDPRFRISAIKSPADGARRGLIVRGYNMTFEDVEVRLTPIRAFQFCDVVRMDESETGGRLAVEQGGRFTFFAPPCRVLTFWLHD